MLEIEHLQSQNDMAQEKIKMLKDARSKDAKDASRKLEEQRKQNQQMMQRIADLEQAMLDDPVNLKSSFRQSMHKVSLTAQAH